MEENSSYEETFLPFLRLVQIFFVRYRQSIFLRFDFAGKKGSRCDRKLFSRI